MLMKLWGQNTVNEVWKAIQGENHVYEVSNCGRVRRAEYINRQGQIKPSHVIATFPNTSGYLRTNLNIDGKVKGYFVHRLVAELFVENPEGKPFVNHIDGNKLNNNANNLEWCTRSENERHAWKIGLKHQSGVRGEKHGMHKLTQKQVDYIRKYHKPTDPVFGSKGLAKKFNVTPQTITDIANYRSWKVQRKGEEE